MVAAKKKPAKRSRRELNKALMIGTLEMRARGLRAYRRLEDRLAPMLVRTEAGRRLFELIVSLENMKPRRARLLLAEAA